jgi:hypothetical protein
MPYTLHCGFYSVYRIQAHDFVVVLIIVHVTKHLRFNKCNYNRLLSLNCASYESKGEKCFKTIIMQ